MGERTHHRPCWRLSAWPALCAVALGACTVPVFSAEFSADPIERAALPMPVAADRARETISQAQTELLALGYDPGPVDGTAGPMTRHAVAEFQRRHGFGVNARVSVMLAAQLAEIGRVRVAQQRLQELGFAVGPVDGVLGPRTRRGIKQFQARHRLAVDGRASAELLAALRRARWTRDAQRGLAQSGYNPGPVDGIQGPRTRRAIGEFQLDHGLVVTGAPSELLIAELNADQRRLAGGVDAPGDAVVPAPAAGPLRSDLALLYDGDIVRALALWRTAAAAGDAVAQHRLGVMRQEGLGVTQDYAAAARWYRRVARQGYVPAQYNLGFLYAFGIGVERSVLEAHVWFALAAQSGVADAVGARDFVALALTPDQRTAADKLRADRVIPAAAQ